MKCNTKIGIFQAKHKLKDINGKTVYYCTHCNKERELENKKQLEQEELDNERENNQIITEYCMKYLQNKDYDFKAIIVELNDDKDFNDQIEKNDLETFKNSCSEVYQASKENSSSIPNDFDFSTSLESYCSSALLLSDDLIKLKKILNKKNLKVSFKQILTELVNIINDDLKNIYDEITTPIYKRISKITKTNKKKIIKEYLKLNFDNSDYETNVMIIKGLFEKFGLDYSDSEIRHLLSDCIENKELDEFENNLGLDKQNNIGEFENLNGHQFEKYLENLFSILGYQVKCTKKSGDQGADLIIKKDNEKTVVQAKKYSNPVTNKAIQEVVASKKYYTSNNAMVVSTSSFTKSAIELAKSNDVELWDKHKLNKVIEEINNQPSQQDFSTKQEVNLLDEDTVQVFCPFCNFDFRLNLDDLPKKGSDKTILCADCKMEITISAQDKEYLCHYCKEDFETQRELANHIKLCPQMKARRFNCKHCNITFYLGDNEFEELTMNGILDVKCPECNKSNILKI
jgi:uncharacterized CHY-type Zn-finger protein